MIYMQLIWSYLKIGLFGFGGGYAMLALIENEIVSPGWISEKMFTDIVAISQMTPGPIGINSATYIGYVAPAQAGWDGWWWSLAGSLICTLTVVIPSFLLVINTSHFISRHNDSAVVRGIFKGLRPVTVGLIASAALLLMNSANFGAISWDVVRSIILCVVAFCIVYFTKIHPIWVVVGAGVAGYLIF